MYEIGGEIQQNLYEIGSEIQRNLYEIGGETKFFQYFIEYIYLCVYKEIKKTARFEAALFISGDCGSSLRYARNDINL